MKKFVKYIIGGTLIAAGCGFFLFPNLREWNTQREVDSIIERFEDTYTLEENKTQENYKKDAEENIIPTVTESLKKGSEKSTSEAEEKDPKQKSKSDEDIREDEKERPFQDLYDEMLDYNNDLLNNGQHLVDVFSYEQPPFDFSKTGLIDADHPVIGYIDIPDMEVRLPLMLGASTENLAKGAAVLSETSMPIGGSGTNCVIAGHRGWEGSAYFQYVENMRRGSKVYVTNPWETLVYECTDIKVIYPDDINSILIQPGKDMITLFTCHPYRLGGGPYRYLVFCERVDTQERSTGNNEIKNPKAKEGESVSDIGDLTIEDINREIDKKNENLTADKEQADTATSTPSVVVEDDSKLDLIALEKTLRYLLPVTLIILSAFIVLIKKSKPIKKNKKKNKKKVSKEEQFKI